MTTLAAERVIALQAELAESPMWDPRAQRLWCVDILAGRIHAIDPGRGVTATLEAGQAVGCIAPRLNNQPIGAAASGLIAIDLDSGTVTRLHAPAAHDPARCRFNDGKCDPQGRLWAGTMGWHGERGVGALYCFQAGGRSARVLGDVSVSNGLAWTRDGRTLYYIDSPTRRVDAFDFDGETGHLSGRRAAITLPPGGDVPDGCAIDDEDMLWVAHWNGGGVSRWDLRTGRQIAFVRVPAPRVTSCAFGGAQRDTLFITTARRGLGADELAAFPESGGIFACRPGVTGPAATAFRG